MTLLRHEKAFQTPNVPACNSIFYNKAADILSLEQWVVWTGSSHWGGVGGGVGNRRPGSYIYILYTFFITFHTYIYLHNLTYHYVYV